VSIIDLHYFFKLVDYFFFNGLRCFFIDGMKKLNMIIAYLFGGIGEPVSFLIEFAMDSD
jgi:hypothetical protein